MFGWSARTPRYVRRDSRGGCPHKSASLTKSTVSCLSRAGVGDGRSWRDAGDVNGWSAGGIGSGWRARDICAGRAGSARGVARAGVGVGWRYGLRALRDGLFRHRVLLGLADCSGDLIFFESQRVLQKHLDGRAYVEKEVVGAKEQRDRGYAPDGSADHGADDCAFCCAAGSGYAGGKAAGRRTAASGRQGAGDGVGLRIRSKVSDECTDTDTTSGECECAGSAAVARVLQSVAVRAFQHHRARGWGRCSRRER